MGCCRLVGGGVVLVLPCLYCSRSWLVSVFAFVSQLWYYQYMLNYFRHTRTFGDSPVIYDSHDDYTPDPVEPEPDIVEEPEFIVADRLSSLEYLRLHS